MPYSGNPSSVKTDAVRLMVGDIYPDMEILSDSEYDYYLTKNNNNINRSAIDAAWAICFKLSRWTRERTGDIEVYGSEWARNFKAVLLEFIRNPNTVVSLAMPYAGGISKSDMAANDADADNARPEAYLGMTGGEHLYNKDNGNGYF